MQRASRGHETIDDVRAQAVWSQWRCSWTPRCGLRICLPGARADIEYRWSSRRLVGIKADPTSRAGNAQPLRTTRVDAMPAATVRDHAANSSVPPSNLDGLRRRLSRDLGEATPAAASTRRRCLSLRPSSRRRKSGKGRDGAPAGVWLRETVARRRDDSERGGRRHHRPSLNSATRMRPQGGTRIDAGANPVVRRPANTPCCWWRMMRWREAVEPRSRRRALRAVGGRRQCSEGDAAGAPGRHLLSGVVWPGGMNGVELAAYVRAHHPDVPVVWRPDIPTRCRVCRARVLLNRTLGAASLPALGDAKAPAQVGRSAAPRRPRG